MARAKGSKKTQGSGRKKGTPNKDKATLQQKAKELGIDPFIILLLFAKGDWKALGYERQDKIIHVTPKGDPIYDDVIDAALRQKSAADAAQYLYSKRKAIEIEDKSEFKPVIVYASEWGSKIEAADGTTPDEDT